MGRQRDFGLSIRLPLTDEVHMALKVAAVKNGTSKGYAIARIVEGWLKHNGYLAADEATAGERGATLPAAGTVRGANGR